MNDPKLVGSVALSALLSRAKSETFMRWYTMDCAPDGWSVDVTVVTPDADESDLLLTVSTPHGSYARVYGLAEQVRDVRGAGIRPAPLPNQTERSKHVPVLENM